MSDTLNHMHILATKLREKRRAAGLRIVTDPEPLPVLTVDDITFRIRNRGPAEHIIEEFMILANMLIARYLIENDLPGIYRIQTEREQRGYILVNASRKPIMPAADACVSA
ncbi:MAG: RNB domain-containing ribonuclease [Actinomycetes bacterium]|nr:RNB domain-containing ribonuclease [Actinomycetes bacterium]